MKILIDKLQKQHSLSLEEYEALISFYNEENAGVLARLARQEREKIYGRDIFIRGLIEISNYCKNDCFYCGIRRSNGACERYRLSEAEMLQCCKEGYELGFRTFVLQGGEDGYFTDEKLVPLIEQIKKAFPDCAVTLSLGERSRESYQRLYNAGADRYLLRHETADDTHYSMLHPKELLLSNRLQCLQNLKEIGYQVGCGFMVGSPGQTVKTLAKDLKWIEEFQPDMCGIGPFIPHHATVYATEEPGSVGFTCFLLSVIRLMQPDILLPATTALGTLDARGRERGILAGANVIMPNLSPESRREQYELYDNKASKGQESAQNIQELKMAMEAIGYNIVTDRGDRKEKLPEKTLEYT